MEDERIIGLYWERSQEAISATDEKYGKYCMAISLNILESLQDAEECVNDTYLRVWNAIPPRRPERFSSFLAKITRNLSLNRYKERRTQKRGGGEVELILDELCRCLPASPSAEKEFESECVSKAIDDFLLSEKAQDRAVFVRRYFHAEPVRNLAADSGMSESKIKSLLFRMRKRLRVFLENEGVVI